LNKGVCAWLMITQLSRENKNKPFFILKNNRN
jgi:hypothetical protein